MDKFLIGKFALLFVFLLSICFGLMGLSIFVGFFVFEKSSLGEIKGFIPDFMSIIQTVVAISALFVAYQGVDAWKRQIKYGKMLSLIWDSMSLVRDFHRKFDDWYNRKLIYCEHAVGDMSEIDAFHKLMRISYSQLLELFSKLDSLVIKDGWRWANYARFINMTLNSIENAFKEFETHSYSFETLKSSLDILDETLNSQITSYEKMLNDVEEKYT